MVIPLKIRNWYNNAFTLPDDGVDSGYLFAESDNSSFDFPAPEIEVFPGSCSEEAETAADSLTAVELTMLNDETVHVHEVLVGEEASATHLSVPHVSDQRRTHRSEIRVFQVQQ